MTRTIYHGHRVDLDDSTTPCVATVYWAPGTGPKLSCHPADTPEEATHLALAAIDQWETRRDTARRAAESVVLSEFPPAPEQGDWRDYGV